MRKHMTTSDLLRVRKLLEKGVTDVKEIQEQVFLHADVIQSVIDAQAPKKPAKKKAAAKAKEPVDPAS